MADRSWKRNLATLASGLVMDSGFVDIASDASVTTATSNHPLGTFTKTGTGEYTLTMTDKYKSVRGVQLTLKAATAVDLVPQVKSEVVGANANTIVFNLNAGATPTNPSAACRVYVLVFYKNSDVEP